MELVTAKHYSTYSKPVRMWAQEHVTKYLKEASRFKRILDMGCGTGENSQFLHKFTGADELTGLDLNPNFLKFAERYSQVTGMQFMQADLNESSWVQAEFRVNKFDLVFSSFALHWVKDIRRVFKEIIDVLEEDGESFHVIGIKPSEPFACALKQLIYHEKWMDDLENFRKASEWLAKGSASSWNKSENPADAMKSILTEAGHEVLLCKEVNVAYTCQSHEESKGMLEWLLPLTKFIPQTKMAEFMEDAHQIYTKYCEKSDSGVPVWTNSVLIVHTRKASSGTSSSSKDGA